MANKTQKRLLHHATASFVLYLKNNRVNHDFKKNSTYQQLH